MNEPVKKFNTFLPIDLVATGKLRSTVSSEQNMHTYYVTETFKFGTYNCDFFSLILSLKNSTFRAYWCGIANVRALRANYPGSHCIGDNEQLTILSCEDRDAFLPINRQELVIRHEFCSLIT
jgi:hypothetical protein